MTRRSRLCPTCSTTGVPVLYGMPAPHVRPAVEQGLLALGGCVIRGGEHSTWWCAECEQFFDGPNTRRAIDTALDSVLWDEAP